MSKLQGNQELQELHEHVCDKETAARDRVKNEDSFFFFTTPGYQMVAPDVVSSGVNMVSNGWCVVIFSEGLEKLSFAIMKPYVSYTGV